jgi:hypothetical protein
MFQWRIRIISFFKRFFNKNKQESNETAISEIEQPEIEIEQPEIDIETSSFITVESSPFPRETHTSLYSVESARFFESFPSYDYYEYLYGDSENVIQMELISACN